jgi:hypothetical protein
MTLVWNMECGVGQVLGFTVEALNFIQGLWNKIRLKLQVNDNEECKQQLYQLGLPRAMQRLIAILLVIQYISTFLIHYTFKNEEPANFSFV